MIQIDTVSYLVIIYMYYSMITLIQNQYERHVLNISRLVFFINIYILGVVVLYVKTAPLGHYF